MLTPEEENQLTDVFEALRNEDNLDHETVLWLATRLQEINKEAFSYYHTWYKLNEEFIARSESEI